MATLTSTDGGALAANARRDVVASCATEINEVVLGSGLMGPQPVTLTGGGAVAVTINAIPGGRMAIFARHDGGMLFAGPARHTAGSLTLAGGGGQEIIAGPHLRGGGSPTISGRRGAANAVSISGGGALAALRVPTGAHLAPCTELLIETCDITLGAAPTPTPAGLYLTLLDTVVSQTPGALVAFVANGTPNGPVVFSIGSLDVLTATFDDAGTVSGISVPVRVSSTGSHQLLVKDTTSHLTAQATFTVSAVQTPVTIGVPVTPPPANVQPGTGVKKWVLQDPYTDESYHFEINPSKMNSPFPPKRISFQATTAVDGARLAFEGQAPPVEWQFEGTLLTKAQYDNLNTWYAKRNRLWLTDHYGRAWLVYLTNYQPVPRRDVRHPWCHDYTMTCLIFEGPVTPV